MSKTGTTENTNRELCFIIFLAIASATLGTVAIELNNVACTFFAGFLFHELLVRANKWFERIE